MAGRGARRGTAPRALDRASPLPLWAQLLSDLQRRLAAGAFTDAFPGELALVAEYAVSRQTSAPPCVNCGPMAPSWPGVAAAPS